MFYTNRCVKVFNNLKIFGRLNVKKILSVCLLSTMLFVIAGCGTQDQKTTSSNPAEVVASSANSSGASSDNTSAAAKTTDEITAAPKVTATETQPASTEAPAPAAANVDGYAQQLDEIVEEYKANAEAVKSKAGSVDKSQLGLLHKELAQALGKAKESISRVMQSAKQSGVTGEALSVLEKKAGETHEVLGRIKGEFERALH